MAEKRLTKETAEEFLVDEKAVDLAAFRLVDLHDPMTRTPRKTSSRY